MASISITRPPPARGGRTSRRSARRGSGPRRRGPGRRDRSASHGDYTLRHARGGSMKRLVIVVVVVAVLVANAQAQPRPAPPTKPDGEMRWALYVTLAPAWFDPGEVTGGFLTPFWVLYALHDALVKPMPGNLMAPSLAESW